MKKNKLFILLFITNITFAQNNIFKDLPYWIGAKVSVMKILDPIKLNSKYFKDVEYSTSENDSVYYIKLHLNKYKNIEQIEKYLLNNNISKITDLNWNISMENCYIDKLNDIEYVIEYNFRDDPSLKIISYKHNSNPFYKDEDKFKKQITYFTTRYSYSELSYKKNIKLDFRFGPNESKIYGVFDFYNDDWYFLNTIYLLIDDGQVIKKELEEINRKVLSSDFIKESYYFELTNEDALKINRANKIDIKVEGKNNNIEYQMSYPQKMSIGDILKSKEYKKTE